ALRRAAEGAGDGVECGDQDDWRAGTQAAARDRTGACAANRRGEGGSRDGLGDPRRGACGDENEWPRAVRADGVEATRSGRRSLSHGTRNRGAGGVEKKEARHSLIGRVVAILRSNIDRDRLAELLRDGVELLRAVQRTL